MEYVVGKFMARSGVKRYNILITGHMEILEDDTEETEEKGVKAKLKLINNISYIQLILSQEDTVCFQLTAE